MNSPTVSPNVRFVYHYDAPDSLDAYYQEVGRAGRDGEPAAAQLFYRTQDMAIHRFFAGGGKVDSGDLRKVAEAVAAQESGIGIAEVREETGLSAAKVNTALTSLEDSGALERQATGEVAPTSDAANVAEAIDEAARLERERRRHAEWRIQQMEAYAEARSCRRNVLLRYFGETPEAPCNNCDVCDVLAGDTPAEVAETGPYPLNARVRHQTLGEGQVLRYEEDRVIVRFPDGEKRLDLALVIENNLLAEVVD